MEYRVSDKSESRELRRRRGRVGDGCTPSAKVAARFSILWRSWEGMWASGALSSTGVPSIVQTTQNGQLWKPNAPGHQSYSIRGRQDRWRLRSWSARPLAPRSGAVMLTFRTSYRSRALDGVPREGASLIYVTASRFWAIVYHDDHPSIFILTLRVDLLTRLTCGETTRINSTEIIADAGESSGHSPCICPRSRQLLSACVP